MSTMLKLLPLLFFTAACASSTSLTGMYKDSRSDAELGDSPENLFETSLARRERVQRVHVLIAEGQVVTSEDQLHAGALLLDSNLPEDLDLAADLALQAAEAGEERGFRLAAEAIDRGLMLRGLPQKYGTQYVWSPISERWTLYPWDETTTDAERSAMGVPSLASAVARVGQLNQESP